MGKSAVKLAAVLVVLSVTPALADEGDRYFRWVDENGVVHFGDRVPPQYVSEEHKVLNHRGVEVEVVSGQKSVEQIEKERREARLAEEALRREEEARLRDRVLLSTYLSVDEIEDLRDRRVELLTAQIRVTELYLDNLRAKLEKLEADAKKYSPYSDNPEARPIDEKLARELADTLDSIMLYEQNLSRSRTEKSAVLAKFDSDIERFQELKQLN